MPVHGPGVNSFDFTWIRVYDSHVPAISIMLTQSLFRHKKAHQFSCVDTATMNIQRLKFVMGFYGGVAM